MSLLITILATAIIFAVIIFIHELGHFTVAKLSGIKVHEFALGMGPTIFKFQKGETKYALRAFPIGGFVSMEGEDEGSDEESAFCNKPVWKRICVILAGAFMNILLGFILMTIITSSQSEFIGLQVGEFREGATSSQSLQVGDKIEKIDGLRLFEVSDYSYAMTREKRDTHNIQVNRGGKTMNFENVKISTVEIDTANGKANAYDLKLTRDPKNVGTVISHATGKTVSFARLIWVSFIDLVTGKEKITELSGPIGVAGVVGQAASMGFLNLLIIAAMITINVGIFNLMPLPALDGGRLIFLLIELVTRKRVPPKYEGYVHGVGLALLLLLMFFVTISDVVKLF